MVLYFVKITVFYSHLSLNANDPGIAEGKVHFFFVILFNSLILLAYNGLRVGDVDLCCAPISGLTLRQGYDTCTLLSVVYFFFQFVF